DPGAGVGAVLTWTEHRVALLAHRFGPELYDKRLRGATRCSRYSLNYFLNIIPELVGLALIMGAWIILVIGLPLYLLVLRKRIVQEEQVMREHFPHYATLRVPPRDHDTPRGHPSS